MQTRRRPLDAHTPSTRQARIRCGNPAPGASHSRSRSSPAPRLVERTSAPVDANPSGPTAATLAALATSEPAVRKPARNASDDTRAGWHKYFIGVADEGDVLVGVAVVGRPVARHLDDGLTLSATPDIRTCGMPGDYRCPERGG